MATGIGVPNYMELCCDVNPCYVCEACNFKECEMHWSQRLVRIHADPAQCHFITSGGYGGTCRVTGKRIACSGVKEKDLTIYKVT